MVYQIAKKIIDGLYGYFYDDGKVVNWSKKFGWYCKDLVDGKINTYNITRVEAVNKIRDSLK